MSAILIALVIAAAFVFASLLLTSTGRAVLFMLTRPRLFQIWLLVRKRQAEPFTIERYNKTNSAKRFIVCIAAKQLIWSECTNEQSTFRDTTESVPAIGSRMLGG